VLRLPARRLRQKQQSLQFGGLCFMGQSVCANGRCRSETVTAGGRMHGTNHFNCGRLLSNAFLGTVPP